MVGSLALFGWLVGTAAAVCSLSAIHFNLSAAQVTSWLLALAAGALAALMPAAGLLKKQPPGTVLAFAALAGAASLATLAAAYESRWIFVGAAMLGLSVGAAAVEATRQIASFGARDGRAKLADLAACAWPAGAAAAGLLIAVGRHFLDYASLSAVLAGSLGALAAVLLRRRASASLPATPRGPRQDRSRHAAVHLQFAAALFQALLYGLVAGWFGLYMNRKLGLTAVGSVAALTLVWLALLVGRAAASRYKTAMKPKIYAAVLSICLVGALFLINTIGRSGALAGSLLIGFGAGALQPLSGVPSLLPESDDFGALTATLFLSSVGAALAGAWAGGWLVQLWGMEAVIWAVLAAHILTALTSLGASLEARLFQTVSVDSSGSA